MPVRIRDYDDGFGVVIEGWGVVGDDEYSERMDAHLSQPDEKLRGYAWTLSDFSAATAVEVAPATLERVAGLCVDAADAGANSIVAFAGATDVVFGLSRMFETLASGTDWTMAVFRSRAEAVDWIRRIVGHRYCSELLVP